MTSGPPGLMDELITNTSMVGNELMDFYEETTIDLPAVVTDFSPSQGITDIKNPLEAILPRHQIYKFVQLFFDYIYCLTPCVHPPSIWRDLRAKREEREGEEEWAHMILSLIASTLAQLPKALNEMPNEECLSTIATCWTAVTTYLHKDAEKCTINRSES